MDKPPIKKIVFIEPKAPGNHVYTKWGLPRLGTFQLGTILQLAGYEVKIFIEDIRGIDFEDVFEADAVGISTITSTAPRAYEMAKEIRKAGIPVFMGGPHVSFMYEEALDYCDYVLRGEAEETIIPFLEALSSGKGVDKIPGLTWKEDDKVRMTDLPEACSDLDKYPIPNFDLIAGKTDKKRDRSVTPIMTSRGCPFGCNFCSVTRMFGRRYRFRSVAHVINELKFRNAEWIFFYDDNFTANRSHTKKLLRRMIEENITPNWMAQVRIDIAKDEELLELMRRSNCKRVYIGLESINEKSLKALNKGQTREDIEEAIKTIHRYGIHIHGMFIFGTDYDDVSTIRKTVKFAKKNELSTVQFMILIPLPGTPVFEQMEREGRLLLRDWAYYDGHYVVFQPKGMSYLQLQKKTIWAMLKFYSLPQVFRKLNQFDIWNMVIRAYGWRITRKTRRNLRDFTKQLKETYREFGESIDTAKCDLRFKARKTSDDLKEFFSSINWEKIRKMKEQQVEKWKASKETSKKMDTGASE